MTVLYVIIGASCLVGLLFLARWARRVSTKLLEEMRKEDDGK